MIDVAIFLAAFFVTVFVAAALDGNLAWVWPFQVGVLTAGGVANLAVLQGGRGTSFGKAIVGIAVVDDTDGQPIGIARGLGRLAIHVFIDPIAFVGLLLMVADPVERRTVADRICRSMVVSTRLRY